MTERGGAETHASLPTFRNSKRDLLSVLGEPIKKPKRKKKPSIPKLMVREPENLSGDGRLQGSL